MARQWITARARNNYKCLECNIDLVCPKCEQSRKMGTPFSLWLRELPSPLNSNYVYNTDIDFVWWHYRNGWFITLEEKQYGKQIDRSQREVLDIIAERLRDFSREVQKTLRGERVVEYRGHYNIIFEKTTPDNSSWIKINGKEATRDDLLLLLENGTMKKKSFVDELVEAILPSFLG